MDAESGESTEEEDVTGLERGESETGMRLTERSRELVPETRRRT